MRGGAIAARWLKAQGATHVFTLCGEHVLPLLDACEEEGLAVVGCRHEQGAVLAAEAYARVSGRPGIAVVTAGPGVTNAVTGLAVATTSGTPVMVLAGRTPTPRRLKGTFQDVDGCAIVETVTTWRGTVYETARIADHLEHAWRRMLGGRPGAVFLELPHDVLAGDADAEVEAVRLPEPPGAPADAIARAVAMLAEAERPVVVAGGGAFWSGAGDALRELAERTRIPVTTVNAARGLLGDGEDASLGPLAHAALALSRADVVLLVGTKLDASITFGGPPLFTGRERLIQVDVEAANIGLNRMPELGITGDARVVLHQLARAWSAPPKDAWLKEAREQATTMREAWEAQANLPGSPVPPGRVAYEVARAGGDRAIRITDGGDIHTWAVTLLPAAGPGSLLATHDALGTIGVGVPYALGAKAAAPDRTVVLCVGDGSFGFGLAELETAARTELPFVAVVANNAAWGNIRYEQGKRSAVSGSTRLSEAAYEKVAEAFGGYGERVERAEDVAPAIERAVASGRVAVVNVVCRQDVVSPVTQMVGELMRML